MKKIIYVFFLLFINFSFAQQELDINAVFAQTTMPSDQEIMQTIQKFNLDEKQTQQIFNETKQKLQLIYSAETQEEMMKIILPEIEKIDRNLDVAKPILKTNPKKLN